MILTVNDIINCYGGKILCGNKDTIINKCVINARLVTPNSCFFGIKNNAKSYKTALINGSSVCVLPKIDNINLKGFTDKTIVIVDDVLKCMQALAKYKRSLFKGHVIGITGSVGKTTTKQYISSVLSTKYNVLKTINNYNGQVGVALTILNYDMEDIMVIEMGISMPGEMKIIADIAKPNIVVITNVFLSHIENFESEDNLVKEKLDIINENTNLVIFNNDNLILKNAMNSIEKKLNTITYGITNESDFIATNIDNGLITSFSCMGYDDIKIKGTSSFIYNALAALTIGYLFKIDMDNLKLALLNTQNENHRLEIIKCKEYTIIDDSYNSSLESTLAAIDYLDNYKERKVAVIGDILEIGKKYKEVYKKIADKIENSDIKLLITVGKKSKYINKFVKTCKRLHFKNEEKLEKKIKRYLNYDDVILLKASHMLELYKLTSSLKD